MCIQWTLACMTDSRFSHGYSTTHSKKYYTLTPHTRMRQHLKVGIIADPGMGETVEEGGRSSTAGSSG